ncbi:MAG: hypothetical protein HYR60_26120 [Acidobacteria bacterium]|nr:hypothetical protein [Acidobacteriota bacterium]
MKIRSIQPSLVRSISPFEHLGVIAQQQQPQPVRTRPQHDWQTLNPQPLPPKRLKTLLNATRRHWSDLNPQPLPPKAFRLVGDGRLNWATLNPQPLPPKPGPDPDPTFQSIFNNRASWAALNPQPLPPRPGPDPAPIYRARIW